MMKFIAMGLMISCSFVAVGCGKSKDKKNDRDSSPKPTAPAETGSDQPSADKPYLGQWRIAEDGFVWAYEFKSETQGSEEIVVADQGELRSDLRLSIEKSDALFKMAKTHEVVHKATGTFEGFPAGAEEQCLFKVEDLTMTIECSDEMPSDFGDEAVVLQKVP